MKQYTVFALNSLDHIIMEDKRDDDLPALKDYVKEVVHISNYDNNRLAIYVIDKEKRVYLDKDFNETTEKVSHSNYDYQASRIFN